MPTPFFADLVRELAQEGGTGPLTPTGAVPGHRRFAGAVPPGVPFHYAVAGIAHPDQWEVGIGRIDGSGRLLRDAVAASSAGGATVDFASGLKTIALTVGADWFAGRDTEAAALADEVAALGGEVATLTGVVATRQPISTLHGSVESGEASDTVTLRRGADWFNIPLSALAFRDADGRYIFGAAVPNYLFNVAIANPARGILADFANLSGAPNGAQISFTQAGINNWCIGQVPGIDAFALYRGRNGAADGTEICRWSGTGLGVGTSPAVRLHVKAGGEIQRLETTTARGGGACYQAFYDPSGAKGFCGYSAIDDGFDIWNSLNHQIRFGTSGAYRWAISSAGGFYPVADNAYTIGGSVNRVSEIYAVNGTINTCDAREKTWRGPPTGAELRAARRIAGELGFFQWNAAIAEKGEDGARLHFGVRAQAVWAIMADEGLIDPVVEGGDPSSRHAFLCYDAGDERGGDEAVADRFGVRTDQLALFLIAAQEARIAALEGAA